MMQWLVTNAIAVWLIPPGCLILLTAWGLVRMRKRPRSGKAMIALSLLALWILSMPWVGRSLLNIIEPEPLELSRVPPAHAIVVLGGGKYHAAPEFGADTVSEQTLVRVRYAAHLHRLTGKPILTSGGSPEGAPQSEAQVMKVALENDFGTPVKWTEQTSNNTLENARASFAILSAQGVTRIYLVTQAWHMPRSKRVFEHAGFTVVPAPTAFKTTYRLTLLDFMPNAYALRDSSNFFHELIGIIWYQLRLALQ
jgi:uncharacterized SAM-binding protein YcdF (DUF218 family)